MDDREQKVYDAKLSEQADRYDDMTRLMTEVAELGCELSQEERNLLSVAFKNAVGARRASWRILTSLEQREEADSKRLQLIKEYREKIEGEMHERCSQLLQLLEKHILPASSDDEARVFFHKMAGDYHRYVAEFADGGARKQAAEDSLLAYKAATEIAVAKLAPTHPVRLGLALNFSVFYYEILNSPDRACRLAKAAFDDAICELDLLSEDDYRDSTLIMQLLRDNLTLWTSDMQAADSSDAAAADNCDATAADSDTAKVEAPQGEVAQPA